MTDAGYLTPQIYSCKLSVGESYFYHDDVFMAFFMHQIVEITIVIIENSIYFIGDYVLNGVMEPVMTGMMNKYTFELPIESPFIGQRAKSTFKFDFRNTKSPDIQQGYMELAIYGLLTHNDNSCSMNP